MKKRKDKPRCGYDMFLGEHVLYGSSRLGTSSYGNYWMGHTDKSLAYPGVQEIYVCYAVADDNPSPFEPLGGTPTGPLGGTTETLKPIDMSRINGGKKPLGLTGFPTLPATQMPTKFPTVFVPGNKRYEFSNHLGNVLVTVSDQPLGVDEGNNGTVDYYMPDVKTTSDYEPFGAPLMARTFGPEICSTYTEITDTTNVGVITDDFSTSYVPNGTASSTVWYEMSTSAVANVTGGIMYFTAAGTGMRAVGRRFTAVSGKSYSLTLDASRVAGVSDNKLQVLILRVSDMDTMYISSPVTLLNSGAAIPVSMPDIFTAPDNAQYILVLGRPGGNNNALIVDNVSFTYAEPVYTTFTDCHNNPDAQYRFGFNGQEKVDDLYGEGNSYEFEYRIYDPRIGRFLSVDPISDEFPWNSTYAYAENDVIRCQDLEGKEKYLGSTTDNYRQLMSKLTIGNYMTARESVVQPHRIPNPTDAAQYRRYINTRPYWEVFFSKARSVATISAGAALKPLDGDATFGFSEKFGSDGSKEISGGVGFKDLSFTVASDGKNNMATVGRKKYTYSSSYGEKQGSEFGYPNVVYMSNYRETVTESGYVQGPGGFSTPYSVTYVREETTLCIGVTCSKVTTITEYNSLGVPRELYRAKQGGIKFDIPIPEIPIKAKVKGLGSVEVGLGVEMFDQPK